MNSSNITTIDIGQQFHSTGSMDNAQTEYEDKDPFGPQGPPTYDNVYKDEEKKDES